MLLSRITSCFEQWGTKTQSVNHNTQVTQNLLVQTAPVQYKHGNSETPINQKVKTLCNYFEFGKAMNVVRRGETFKAIEFEPDKDRSLFPKDKSVLISEFFNPFGEAIIPEDFTQDDVKTAIKTLSVSSAPGPSGISFSHLKLLKEKGAFATNFAAFANKLFKDSKIIGKLNALYKVRVIFILKENG